MPLQKILCVYKKIFGEMITSDVFDILFRSHNGIYSRNLYLVCKPILRIKYVPDREE